MTLTVNNVVKTGPAGLILYRFEVSNSPSFASLLFVNTVSEQGGGQTSVQLSTANTLQGSYFWRVQASDPSNAVTTGLSGVMAFTYQPFSMRDATIWNNPQAASSNNASASFNARRSSTTRSPGFWLKGLPPASRRS